MAGIYESIITRIPIHKGWSVEFWHLLALYICSNTLGSLPWALDYGGDEVQVMRAQAAQVLRWYDNMRRAIPTWYQQR